MQQPPSTSTPRRIAVVGAGLAGLSCAHALQSAGHEVRVLEAAPHAGGVVGTLELDGFRFERGPNTVLASSVEFRTLAHELGLTGRLVVSPADRSARYLWHRDRLHALPERPLGWLTTALLSWRGKLRLASEVLRRFRAPAAGADPDLASFFSERLGPEAATRLAGAFVRGVYAAELSELGARSAFPRMWQACVERGGLIRGLARAMPAAPAAPGTPNAPNTPNTPNTNELPGPKCSPRALLSFEKGLGELVEALVRSLGDRVETGSTVIGLERGARGWSLDVAGRERVQADEVVLAASASATASLLAHLSGAEPSAATLRAVRHARVTLVHLGFEARELPGFPPGFGFLVPPDAGSSAPRVLGTIFGSNLFAGRAPEGCIGVTSFYTTHTCAAWGADEIAREASADLARALRLARTPQARVTHVQTWEDVIPRYASGHRDRIDALEHELSAAARGLHLAGNFTGGVSVEQVLARGRSVARRIR